VLEAALRPAIGDEKVAATKGEPDDSTTTGKG
jgi:hypothetical protein